MPKKVVCTNCPCMEHNQDGYGNSCQLGYPIKGIGDNEYGSDDCKLEVIKCSDESFYPEERTI